MGHTSHSDTPPQKTTGSYAGSEGNEIFIYLYPFFDFIEDKKRMVQYIHLEDAEVIATINEVQREKQALKLLNFGVKSVEIADKLPYSLSKIYHILAKLVAKECIVRKKLGKEYMYFMPLKYQNLDYNKAKEEYERQEWEKINFGTPIGGKEDEKNV